MRFCVIIRLLFSLELRVHYKRYFFSFKTEAGALTDMNLTKTRVVGVRRGKRILLVVGCYVVCECFACSLVKVAFVPSDDQTFGDFVNWGRHKLFPCYFFIDVRPSLSWENLSVKGSFNWISCSWQEVAIDSNF
jgi:hypothetical protein